MFAIRTALIVPLGGRIVSVKDQSRRRAP